MIKITDLRGVPRYVNADMIEYVVANPETQVVMTSGQRIYVQESMDIVAEKVIEYRRRCFKHLFSEHVPGQPVEERNNS